MATLSLTQLLQLANLSPEVKKEALVNLDKMSEEQQFQLSQICWETIAQHCQNQAAFEHDKMIGEMANGEAEYGPDDFARIEDKVLTELLAKIEGMETTEQISAVKEELKEHLQTPVEPQK